MTLSHPAPPADSEGSHMSDRTPLVSIIMVDGGFRENFEPLQSWLDQTLERDLYELIWIEYGSQVAPQVQALSRVHTHALGREGEPQIIAHAFNEGIRQARGDLLVLPDADVVCEPDLLETLAEELMLDPGLVVYLLRLDQPQALHVAGQGLESLRRTCSIRNTFNYGGCPAVHRRWMIEMNGYEQLPFFAGYHHNGADNYIRFKNLGLKIRWHPSQRVYHPWHPVASASKFATAEQQEQFVRRRAATWDWLAYDGLDPSRNRQYDPSMSVSTEWQRVLTERGVHSVEKDRQSQSSMSLFRRMRGEWHERGLVKGSLRIVTRLLARLSS